MLERLLTRGAALGAARVSRAIERIASAAELPKGVTLERSVTGITLIGRRLKLRLISGARVRSLLSFTQGAFP
jgi:hypothetical protein